MVWGNAAVADPIRQTASVCPAVAAGSQPRLHVVVSGARRVAGNITFTLYGEQRGLFLVHHGWLAQTRMPVARGVQGAPAGVASSGAEACFAVSAPGTYAVAVFHDENDNHHFDLTLLGLPAEGYGFSNDAPIRFGPPSFEQVRITVRPGDNPVPIRLRY